MKTRNTKNASVSSSHLASALMRRRFGVPARRSQVRPPPEDVSRHPLGGVVSDPPLQRGAGVPPLWPTDSQAAHRRHVLLGAGRCGGQEAVRQGLQGKSFPVLLLSPDNCRWRGLLMLKMILLLITKLFLPFCH